MSGLLMKIPVEEQTHDLLIHYLKVGAALTICNIGQFLDNMRTISSVKLFKVPRNQISYVKREDQINNVALQ